MVENVGVASLDIVFFTKNIRMWCDVLLTIRFRLFIGTEVLDRNNIDNSRRSAIQCSSWVSERMSYCARILKINPLKPSGHYMYHMI
jgi:hypothetical protein